MHARGLSPGLLDVFGIGAEEEEGAGVLITAGSDEGAGGEAGRKARSGPGGTARTNLARPSPDRSNGRVPWLPEGRPTLRFAIIDSQVACDRIAPTPFTTPSFPPFLEPLE